MCVCVNTQPAQYSKIVPRAHIKRIQEDHQREFTGSPIPEFMGGYTINLVMSETFSGNIYVFFPVGKKFLLVGLVHNRFRNISNVAYEGS